MTMTKRKYLQGKYSPKNPSKYIGDPTQIVYRSSWELRAMNAFDTNPKILRWGSEELVVPYYWEGDDKWHRYFTDFIILVENGNGTFVKIIVEVKPFAQTKEPKKTKRKREKTFIHEITQYSKNMAKWAATRDYCLKNNCKFWIMTEKDLFPNGKSW